jgi:uncharacterized protein (TIGR01777 family)
MRCKKIVIAGGSGFIGEELIRYFGKENEVCILTRNLPGAANNRNRYYSLKEEETIRTRWVQWDGKTIGEWANELDGADLLINLSGKTVNCRYTAKNRAEILSSRIDPVNALGKAIASCKQPPTCWINASSATIYRDARDRAQDEYNGDIISDFSVDVCTQWEKALYDQSTPLTRKIALRMAVTLGAGGVMIPYFNLLKFGLGGHQGDGGQQYSWIHIRDTCRIIEWIFENEELEGSYNASSPFPVTNSVFMKTLRKVTGYKTGLPAFTWMLKMGAFMIGTETELVLKSRWVVPTRILETGFVFCYPFLEEAMGEVVGKVPRRQYRLWG